MTRCALLLSIGALYAVVASSAGANGSWQARPPMLHARAAHAVVSTGAAIYALAGTGPGGPVLEVEHFDGRAWSIITTLPGGGLNAPAAALLGDRIYLIGGFGTTTNVPVSTVRVYDIGTQVWMEAAPLPAPRGGHGSAVLDGKIHVAGGGNSEATIADHSQYDPATNTWRELAPLPRAEGSPALVAFAGRLYAIGGRSGYSDFGDVYVYDPVSDKWDGGPSIPPRGTAGAVVYCGAIHVFGGESQPEKRSLDDVLRLDVATGTWTALTPMPTARNFARAVIFGGEVHVVGGSPTAGSSHDATGSPTMESYQDPCTQ